MKNRTISRRATPWLIGAFLLITPALAGALIGARPAELVAELLDDDSSEDSGVIFAEPVRYDIDAIRADGRLVVGLPTNTTSYLLYRGAPRGFEYEILQQLADDLDVSLEVRLLPQQSARLEALYAGEVDIIGGRLSPAGMTDPRLGWTDPLYEDTASVVQRVGPPEERYPDDVLDAVSAEEPPVARWPVDPIDTAEDLAGRTVWSRGSTGHPATLRALSEALHEEIEVVAVAPVYPSESLVRWVATGQADLSVTYTDLAEMRAAVFENLEIHPIIDEPQPISFAARASSTGLLGEIDAWLAEHPDEIAALYQRYFIDRRSLGRAKVAPLDGPTDELSPFDTLFQRAGEAHDLDWLLLASVAYQESRFRPRVRSWAGAAGLMQIMPATARELGVTDRLDPAQSVDGAARYLVWLDEQLQEHVADPGERMKFALASYNAGLGHVYDAQRLAEAEGGDPELWADVSWWMLQLSRRDVYSVREEVRHGYCRGIEPVLYVDQIIARHRHYREFYTEL